MKRNVLAAFLAICLLAMSFAGCDISSFLPNSGETNETMPQKGSEIKDAAAWDAAFESLELSKYTLEEVRRNTDNEVTSSVSYAYTDNGASYCDKDDDVYTVKNSDGTFTTYRHMLEANVTLILNDTSSYYYNRIRDMSAACLSFAGQFDKFTYDENSHSYVSEEMVEAPYAYPNGSKGTWYCSKTVIAFVDGKVNSIAVDFSTSNAVGFEHPVHTFRFFDIGTAVAEIPQSVIDAARPESMQSIYPVMQQNASPIKDAAAWDSAINDLTMTNYSATMIRRGNYGESQTRHCVFTEDGAYFHYSYTGDYYTKVDADGRFATYYRPWGELSFMIVEDVEGHLWDTVNELMTYNLSLEGKFDKFTYDAESGSYICEDVLEITLAPVSGDEASTIYSSKIIVQLVNGKIRTIIIEFRNGADEKLPVNTLSYFNIGTSVVEIPQEVIDEAQPMPQIPVAPNSAN